MENRKRVPSNRDDSETQFDNDDLFKLQSMEIGRNSSTTTGQTIFETKKEQSESKSNQSNIRSTDDRPAHSDQSKNRIGLNTDDMSQKNYSPMYCTYDADDKDDMSTKSYGRKYGPRKSDSDILNYPGEHTHGNYSNVRKEKTSYEDDDKDHVREQPGKKETTRDLPSKKKSVNRDNKNNQDGGLKSDGTTESAKSVYLKNKRGTGTEPAESTEIATKRYKDNKVTVSSKSKNSKSTKKSSDVHGKAKLKSKNDFIKQEQENQQDEDMEAKTLTHVKVTKRNSGNGKEVVTESATLQTRRQSDGQEEESQRFSQFVSRKSNYDEEIQEMQNRKLMILDSISPNASFGSQQINAETNKPPQINLNLDMKISLSSSKTNLREETLEDNPDNNTFSGRFYTNMEKIIAVKQYIKVLFPRCGDANEVTWLLQNGHEVVIIEEDERLIRTFFRECDIKYDFENCRAINGNLYRGLDKNIRMYNTDFISFPSFLEADIDVIWDSDGLRSAEKGAKKKFIKVINSLMQSGANYFMVVNGPDASSVPKELFLFQDVVENAFQIQKLETVEDQASSPNPSKNDKSQLYLLTKL